MFYASLPIKKQVFTQRIIPIIAFIYFFLKKQSLQILEIAVNKPEEIFKAKANTLETLKLLTSSRRRLIEIWKNHKLKLWITFKKFKIMILKNHSKQPKSKIILKKFCSLSSSIFGTM